jgi:alpha-L-arabinofuranosidase
VKRLATVLFALLLTTTAAVIPSAPAGAVRHAAPAAAAELGGDTAFYKIVNRASGRLLSVVNGGTGEGDDLVVYDDVNASDQLWTIEDADLGYSKLINKRSGRALSMTDGATSNGTIAHLWHYLSTASDQDWTISPGNAGYVKLTNRKRPAAALSVVGGATANNSRVQTWDYLGAADQDWQIVPVQTFDPNKLYQIVNTNSRHALSVFQGATTNNSIADLFEFINQPDQFWRIVDVGGGYYHVVNYKSGRLLSLLGGQTGNGTRAMIFDDVGATDQGWAIKAGPDGLYRFANQRRPSGILSIVNAATARESQAQIWDDVAARDQTWQIQPAGNAVSVNASDTQAATISPDMTGAGMEDVNHEIYGGIYSQMIYGEVFGEPPVDAGVSGEWRRVATGSAAGSLSLTTDQPFQGAQSQRISYTGGSGRLGVENRGLNRWGINITAGMQYEGYAYFRTPGAVPVTVSAESTTGTSYGSTTVTANSSGWTKYPFAFTATANDTAGRIAITLSKPGQVDIGYVFVQPGPAGRYKGLPVRKDIADAMVAQHLTVLRFGGSAVLADGYRWKNMIGPREFRPILRGYWSNKFDTNGWGIVDFLNYAEALGVLGIPTFNIDETPGDMADFVDYLNAPATTTWGAKRAADGHPAPYNVHQLELGNEQRVDDAFAAKFNALARAIWAKDPTMTLTVGDLEYHDVIADPDQVTGADSGLTSLSAYRSILDTAATMHGHLAIDLHIWSSDPLFVPHMVDVVASFDTWIQRYQPSVDYRINIFELNADQHDVSRALANAVAISQFESKGNRVSVVTSANALQPDGQNDDGWNQGLIFFDTHRSWLQPPGYVTQMIANSYLPTAVQASTSNPALTVTAKTGGGQLQLQLVNNSADYQTPTINLTGFTPTSRTMQITQLAGNLSDQNNAGNVTQVTPTSATAGLTLSGSSFSYQIPPHSFTILRLH